MFTRSRDPETGETIYLRICRVLEDEIRRGYRSGEFLPAEHILADRFGVNRHTVRRAIDELIYAGVVERRRGRGTMVLDPMVIYPIHAQTRFTETLEGQGRAPDAVVVEKHHVAATPGVAEALGISEGREVIWLEVLRLVDSWPFSVASSFLPTPRFDAVFAEFDGGSLHSFLARRYACTPRRSWSRITAVMPRTEDAHRLKNARNRPLLRVKSLNVDPTDGTPVEYCVSRMRADRIQLEVTP